MTSFVDNQGDRWTLEMTFRAFRRLHAAGFDASALSQLEQLANDPNIAMMVFMELADADLVSRNVSQEDFEKRFDMEVLEKALQAAVEAIVDFFPEPRRTILRTIYDKVRTAAQKGMEAEIVVAQAQLKSGDMDTNIERWLNTQRGNVLA